MNLVFLPRANHIQFLSYLWETWKATFTEKKDELSFDYEYAEILHTRYRSIRISRPWPSMWLAPWSLREFDRTRIKQIAWDWVGSRQVCSALMINKVLRCLQDLVEDFGSIESPRPFHSGQVLLQNLFSKLTFLIVHKQTRHGHPLYEVWYFRVLARVSITLCSSPFL